MGATLFDADIYDRSAINGQSTFATGNSALKNKMDALGYSVTQGGNYYGSNGQTLTPSQAQNMLDNQASVKTLGNASNYNPGVNYQSAIAPYMSQSGGGSSAVSQNNEYANKLKALMANPDSIAKTGAYQFQYNQGQQALERSAAARGMSGSGNVLAELMKYGQGQASQAYDTEANRLAALSGSENQFILGKMSAANQEFATGKQNNALMGQLALTASKAQSDDYWKAQQAASNYKTDSGYFKNNVW